MTNFRWEENPISSSLKAAVSNFMLLFIIKLIRKSRNVTVVIDVAIVVWLGARYVETNDDTIDVGSGKCRVTVVMMLTAVGLFLRCFLLRSENFLLVSFNERGTHWKLTHRTSHRTSFLIRWPPNVT